MSDMFGYSDLDAQIKCVERELGYREWCYPRWVEGKRMTQQKADQEIGTMRAVLESLHRLKGLEN